MIQFSIIYLKKFNPKVSSSVDAGKGFYFKKSKDSIDFKRLPEFMKIQMHDKVTEVLKKKKARLRNKTGEPINISKDFRNEIANRIFIKLQNWPNKGVSTGKAFKKFYWTKDYTHWAFANDTEVVDGYLVKP